MNACDRLDGIADEILTEDSSRVEGLWRDYVNAYLACLDHPEAAAASSSDLDILAAEIVSSLGVSKPLITEKITREQLVALVAGKENPSTDPSTTNVDSGADPVMMFNGQFVHQADDLAINGAGMDFVFARTYKNQVDYRGPLGANWDFSYNLWLREADATIFRATGELREEAYLRHPKFGQTGFSYWIPPDGQDGVILAEGDSFAWRAPNGVRHVFERDAQPFLHRLLRIEDRQGNFLRFQHLGGRLRRVEVNNPGRTVEFSYDTADRIEFVQDFTGRRWRYRYDAFGDLVTVTSPSVADHQAGLTVCYDYSSASFSGQLQHNLTRIVDPSGQVYLVNEYGIGAGTPHFNRVTRQRLGGGEISFSYDEVSPEFGREYEDADRPAHQTTAIERNGHPVHYIYNGFGNLLATEETIIEASRARCLIWRYRYNRDGALVGTLSPEGVVTQHVYGREFYLQRHGITETGVPETDKLTMAERQGFGRLLSTVQRGRRTGLAPLDLSGDVWADIFATVSTGPDDIVVKYTYEPIYGHMLTQSDPRFTDVPDPGVQTAIDGENPRYQETLTRFSYDAPGDPRVLATIALPRPILPDGTLGSEIADSFTAYDARGRLLRHVSRVGVVSEYVYFGAADGVREGYLRRKTVDPGGLAIITEYEVDLLGRIAAKRLPRSVGAPPGEFVVQLEHNDLDQVTREVGSAPFGFSVRRHYDCNRNLVREERDATDEDGIDLPEGPEVRTFCYDAEFNLVEEAIGGPDRATRLVTRHSYDVTGQRVLTVLPAGNSIRYCYDERLLPVSQTMGYRTTDAATFRTQYDGDGRVRQTVDARGNRTRFEHDAFGRVIAEEDALGNVHRRNYDKAGNLIVERTFEPAGSGAYTLLTRTQTVYDEANRPIRNIVNRFDTRPGPVAQTDLPEAFRAAPGPGSVLATDTFRDASGRPVRIVDPMGREVRLRYDALDRVTAETDPLGNSVQNGYDAHGNLVRSDRRELVRDPLTGSVTGEQVFSTSARFDQLDRRVESTDSLGNGTRYFHDSRGNCTGRIDPLGNIGRMRYDIYGRRSVVICEQTATGLGGGAPLATAVQRFEYDANGNPAAVIDALGRRTEYAYDALDRRRSVTFPDGSRTETSYDPDGNVVALRDNNGLLRILTADALGRTTHVLVDAADLPAGLQIGGATFLSCRYDALGRRVFEANDFAECTCELNSLGWLLRETTSSVTPEAPSAAQFQLERSYNDAGAVTEVVHPGGRRLRCHRDDLDRLVRVENLANGPSFPGHPDSPGARDLARFDYRGLLLSRCSHATGAATNYAHDGAGRLIEIAHSINATAALTLQYLFDSVGNQRIRIDATPVATRAEAAGFDSFGRLANVDPTAVAPFDPALHAPATGPPAGPIPNRQAAIDLLIGPLALAPGPGTWTYDLVGNRLSETPPAAPAVVYGVNALDQYVTVGATPIRYDANGNLIDDGTHVYRYDYMNRLVEIARPDSTARFLHDARGRRIMELRQGRVTQLVYDGPNPIEEYRDGALFAAYLWDDGPDRPLQIACEGGEHCYHRDAVGSVRLLSDRDGNATATYRYAQFGAHAAATDGPYNPLRFAGRRFDPEVDGYDFRVRHYAPHLGRFLQRDPAGMIDGSNLYAYAGNNPLSYIDPTGLAREEVALCIGEYGWVDAEGNRFVGDAVNERGFEVASEADYAAAVRKERALRQRHLLDPGPSVGLPPSHVGIETDRVWLDNTYYIPKYEIVPLFEPAEPQDDGIAFEYIVDGPDFRAAAPRLGAPVDRPFSSPNTTGGIIYVGYDRVSSRYYIGSAQSLGHAQQRWLSHARNNPGKRLEFYVREAGLPGGPGTFVPEETHIRRNGGPWIYEGGRLLNGRYEASDARYNAFGGTEPRPTPNRRLNERIRNTRNRLLHRRAPVRPPRARR